MSCGGALLKKMVPVQTGQGSELIYSHQEQYHPYVLKSNEGIQWKLCADEMTQNIVNGVILGKMIKTAVREEQNQDHTHSLRSKGRLFFLLKEV